MMALITSQALNNFQGIFTSTDMVRAQERGSVTVLFGLAL